MSSTTTRLSLLLQACLKAAEPALSSGIGLGPAVVFLYKTMTPRGSFVSPIAPCLLVPEL